MRFNKEQTNQKLQTALSELDDVNEFGTLTGYQGKILDKIEHQLTPVVDTYLADQKRLTAELNAKQKKDDDISMNIFLHNQGTYGYNQLFKSMFPKLTKKQLGKQVLHNYEHVNKQQINMFLHQLKQREVEWQYKATVNAIKHGKFIPKGTFYGVKSEINYLNADMRDEYLVDDDYNAVCTKAALDYFKSQLKQYSTVGATK